MPGRIRDTAKPLPSVRDMGLAHSRVDAATVQAALGAEAGVGRFRDSVGPISLATLRAELARRLQSSGGRPGLVGTTRRAKVPLSEEQWLRLEELAAAVFSPGFAPSAGQVASVLLDVSLEATHANVCGRQPK